MKIIFKIIIVNSFTLSTHFSYVMIVIICKSLDNRARRRTIKQILSKIVDNVQKKKTNKTVFMFKTI